jgi:hypothetical protein
MAMVAAVPGTQEYRVVLVQPDTHRVFAMDSTEPCLLPRVRISSMGRPAQQLQKVIKVTWGIDAFILDICGTVHSNSPCAVAELLSPSIRSDFKEITLDRIAHAELSIEDRQECERLRDRESTTPVTRIGWIDEAVRWVASATGRRFSAKGEIEQLNAGTGYALLRLHSDDGRGYWLKATGVPNIHELSITCCLSELCPEFLPKLVAHTEEWNAWLTEDSGKPLSAPPADTALLRAVQCFASLQLQTIHAIDVLVSAGAFDQRLPVLKMHIDGVTAFLSDAMGRQTSTRVPPLSRQRIQELGAMLHDACDRLNALDIPDALIHNDLNLGNILDSGTNCVFTDWSEAAVGNPLLSLERFRLLKRDTSADLARIYRECWRDYLTEETVYRAQRMAPLLTIFAYLYGRGDWLKDLSKVTPQFESYARSLARHMDRAAQSPELQEALCR